MHFYKLLFIRNLFCFLPRYLSHWLIDKLFKNLVECSASSFHPLYSKCCCWTVRHVLYNTTLARSGRFYLSFLFETQFVNVMIKEVAIGPRFLRASFREKTLTCIICLWWDIHHEMNVDLIPSPLLSDINHVPQTKSLQQLRKF